MRVRAAVLALLAAGALAVGCSSPTPPPSTPESAPVSAEHADADVAFAQQMIPHHSQAVTMSGEAGSHGASPEVAGLAQRIGAAQGPEIERMKAMLAAWGAPAPAAAPDPAGMPGPSMGEMGGMPGMVDDDGMNRLAAAHGPEFDHLFLALMTGHHQGAVGMARTELAQGRNPQARALAQSIVDGQQREIGEMSDLQRRN